MKKLFLIFCLSIFLIGCTSPDQSYSIKNIDIGVSSGATPFTGEIKPVIRVSSLLEYSEFRSVYGKGSGVFVQHKGKIYILTAYHVVDESNVFGFFTSDRKPLDITVKRLILFPEIDAAVFEIASMTCKVKPLKIGSGSADDEIKAIGYPLNGDYLESRGRIISSNIKSTAVVAEGMSGGAVVDKDNNVVGITSMKCLGEGLIQSIFVNTDNIFSKLESIDHK